MESDSDSDSDGSHISATPPRSAKPPSQPPPPLSFSNSKTALKALFSSHSKHISKPSSKSHSKPSSRASKPPPKSDHKPSPQESTPQSFPLPTLPFQIRRLSDHNPPGPTVDGFEILPATHLSKSASFSKIRRPFLNIDPVQTDSSPSSPNLQKKVEIGVTGSSPADREVIAEGLNSGNSVRAFKKHPNLIGSNVAIPPVKFRKCGNEGNFVRLNLNGFKRKFLNKGRKTNTYASVGRKSYRRGKRKFKAGGGSAETEGICDEEGLIAETPQPKQRKQSGGDHCDFEAIEVALLAVRNESSDENLMKLLKLTYGHDSFREGQLEAIKMVLDGKSTMLVLPTGAGKSLCYQLPAMIFSGITLVVSPLVALMIDQLKQLAPMIHGGLLSSSQSPEEVSETLRLLHEGSMKVLFVSPERFLNANFLSIFSGSLSISLVVVDEAHCISEWSHNFRPSYMRLRASLLRSLFNVECILAMTATATTATLHAVMSALEIPPINLIQKATLRENLNLSVSISKNRMKDLLMLIKSTPFLEVQSIIVYCKFQSETDILSKYLCDHSISAKSYHSGHPAKDRKRIQELFCSNKIKVVVATVAFGMGLDKRDVGAVIHYSLPESLEEYVQEIGRAGRDGRLSYCHLFLDDDTYFKLRSLMYSDGVDEYAVNKFLSQVFSFEKNLCGKLCSIVKESVSRKFDMKEEVMLTILTHLELGEVQYLHLLPQLNGTCTLNFHKTSPALLAEKDIVVAEVLKKSETKRGQYVFDVTAVVNGSGVTASDLLNHLQNLKLKGEITYELKDLAFCYIIKKIPEDICSLSAHIKKWLSEIETCKVRKMDLMYNAVDSAMNACEKTDGCCGDQHTHCLQRKILSYFNGNDNHYFPNKMSKSSRFLRADIKVFLQSNSQAKFTPRAVARIMHGIASPAYPSTFWSKTHFWGRYKHIDFPTVMEAAKAELMNVVGKGEP